MRRISPRSPPLAGMTVSDAHGDLLEVQPLDLGPGTPATIALEHERGPQPHNAIKVATSSAPARTLTSRHSSS